MVVLELSGATLLLQEGGDRDWRGVLQAIGAHHADIHPGDRQDRRRAPRRRRHRPGPRLRTGFADGGVVGEERRQVRPRRDRADPRPAAPVGDAERLVQVEVRHIGAEPTRLGQAHQCVQVGPIQIDLSAVSVDEVTDLDDRVLKHPMGRGVSDHQRRQPIARGWA